MCISALQKARYEYKPKLPETLSGSINDIAIETGAATDSIANQDKLKSIFKLTYGKPLVSFTKGHSHHLQHELKVGVILSGGQAPGGHNVIAGLYDGLKKGNANSVLYGFLGGPSGLIDNKTKILQYETEFDYTTFVLLIQR